MSALWIIILLGLTSVVYGVWAYSDVMKRDAGSMRMQEIAGAVAEGAQAYLRRQYITISVVGIVLFVGLYALLGGTVAVGFLIGAILSGVAGFIGMNVRCAPTCAPRRPPPRASRPASTSPSRRAR